MEKQVNSNELVNKNAGVLSETSKAKALRTLTERTESRVVDLVKQGRLNLPKNYSVGNALNSARLMLENTKDMYGVPVLNVCTSTSIMNSLLDMAILGLNPAKKQGYFIAYKNQLTWFTSVYGNMAVLKRLEGVETEPVATIIYENDVFDLVIDEEGYETVRNHTTSWANKNSGKYLGAYATVKVKGIVKSEVMTMAQIKEAWQKSQMKNKNHDEFTTEFMKRTVINRLVKRIIFSSDDKELLLVQTMIKNEEQHFNFEEGEEAVNRVIATNANTGEVVDVPHSDETVEEYVAPYRDAQTPVEEEDDPYKGFDPKNFE